MLVRAVLVALAAPLPCLVGRPEVAVRRDHPQVLWRVGVRGDAHEAVVVHGARPERAEQAPLRRVEQCGDYLLLFFPQAML